MDTLHPVIAASLAAFAPPARWPEHIHGATGRADYLSLADIRAGLERDGEAAAEKIVAAIAAVPQWAVTPSLVASVAKALHAKCVHLLHEDARDAAQGYLTDLADDMRWHADRGEPA